MINVTILCLKIKQGKKKLDLFLINMNLLEIICFIRFYLYKYVLSVIEKV